MAAKRGRSITNFGGFLNPLAIGGSGEPPTVPVALTLYSRSGPALTLPERSAALTLFSRLGPALTLRDRPADLTLFPRTVALTLRPKTDDMPHSAREAVQSDLRQGVDERIIYTITTTPWVTDPASTIVIVKDVDNDYADVTATLMPINTPTESGDVITLSLLRDGTQDTRYRIEVKFTAGGGTWEPWFEVVFER